MRHLPVPTYSCLLRLLFLALFSALSNAACTSNQERFDTATRLVGEGRYTAAADEYIRVLESDPNFPGARDGLLEAGDLAVENFITDARSEADRSAFPAASNLLVNLDRFVNRVARHQVRLERPSDYQAFSQGVHQQALSQLIEEGTELTARGEWSRALDRFSRARTAPGGSRQARTLDNLVGTLHLNWAEEEMDDGEFRSAAGHLDEALALLEAEDDLDRAAQLQDQAIDLGTLWTAFLPVFVSGDGEDSPRGFDQALEGLLLFEYWSRTPPFVGQIDPADQRRVLRRGDVGLRPPSLRQAARVGEDLGADLVLITELTSFTAEESDIRRVRKEARMSAGRRTVAQDTAYTEVRITLNLTAELTYTLVDPSSREVRYTARVDVAARGRVEWGEFEGDPATLNISSEARDLFDVRVEEEARREVEDELIDDLAERYADRVFDRIIRDIP